MSMFEWGIWLMMVGGFLAVAVPAYWLVSGWWQDAQEQRWFTPSKREAGPDVGEPEVREIVAAPPPKGFWRRLLGG